MTSADDISNVEQPAHIFVVDDEPAARRLLTRILEKRGYRTSSAADVPTAVQALKELDVALVLTDLDMPGGSGLELIENLQQTRPDVATILVTGRGSTDVASSALMSGAYGYLSKPFLQDEVEITVLNALRRRELELESRRYQERLEATVRERTADLVESLAQLQAAQDELQKSSQQLLELERMKAQFIQVVSHELRTPLTVIRGGVQTVLRAGASLDPALRDQLLRSAESNAGALGRMIDKILAVNAIRRGTIETKQETLFLDEVARGVTGLEDGPDRRRLVLRLSAAPACGDRSLVVEAVRDLVENALMHTEGNVTVSSWQAGDEAVVAVADEGPGIDPALLKRLLEEPFVQGDSSTTRTTGGLGLSLFLARRIAEASGGRLDVETSASGSTLSLVLPATSAD